MRILSFFLSLAAAFAAVDGTVNNRTTGKPQPGAMVLLFKIGQTGPEMLASTKADAGGKFSFPQTLEAGPHLIEIAYGGVTYNSMLPPGTPTTNVQIDVYDSSRKPGNARITQHMVLLEPAGEQLMVSETFFLQNDGSVTWHDPENGTLHFFAPAAAKDSLRVTALAPHGMSVQRVAEPAGPPDVYKLNFAIKPGETRVDVSYSMPFTSPGAFSSKAFAPGVPTRIVVPSGVTLSGEGLKPLGQEPTTQGSIFETSAAAYKLNIQGTGSLRAAAGDDSGDNGPTIDQILPRVYDRLAWVLIPALVTLALGFILLYRRGARLG